MLSLALMGITAALGLASLVRLSTCRMPRPSAGSTDPPAAGAYLRVYLVRTLLLAVLAGCVAGVTGLVFWAVWRGFYGPGRLAWWIPVYVVLLDLLVVGLLYRLGRSPRPGLPIAFDAPGRPAAGRVTTTDRRDDHDVSSAHGHRRYHRREPGSAPRGRGDLARRAPGLSGAPGGDRRVRGG